MQKPLSSDSPMAAIALEVNNAIHAAIKLQAHFRDLGKIHRLYFDLRKVSGAARVSAKLRREVLKMCTGRGIAATCDADSVVPDGVFLNIILNKVSMTPSENEQYEAMLKNRKIHHATLL